MLDFRSDYTCGMHPEVLKALADANGRRETGYGADTLSAAAAERIRAACDAPEAAVYFLCGGTQVNAVALDGLLNKGEGVLSADHAHIYTHEAGAIEALGHKVLGDSSRLSQTDKLRANILFLFCRDFYADESHAHMVAPGAVYLSQPDEMGNLYSLEELTEIRRVCDDFHMRLYVDGARLAYALASPDNDVTLPDLARLCDAFTIGGTKCGAAFGEALVLKNEATVPHFETLAKRRGALLAKGRMIGAQFLALFTNGLYTRIGQAGNRRAKTVLAELRMRELPCRYAPTNQVFFHVNRAQYDYLKERVLFSTWENRLDGLNDATLRLVTDWATEDADVEALCGVLREMP